MKKQQEPLETIYRIQIGQAEFACTLDHRGAPTAIYNQKVYKTYHSLLNDAPEIAYSGPLKGLAFLIDFFFGQKDYLFIQQPMKFQEEYLHTIEFEKNSLDYFPSRLIDHGVFDVREIKTPHVHNNELIYYVQNKQTFIPLKALCPFPIPSGDVQIRYQLLPYALP